MTMLLEGEGMGMGISGPEVPREEERGKDAQPSKMVRHATHIPCTDRALPAGQPGDGVHGAGVAEADPHRWPGGGGRVQ